MSKPKFEKGVQIYSIADFEQYPGCFFKVFFGNHVKTVHRAFLESWQYRTLQMFILHGRVYEANEVKNESISDHEN